MCWILLLEKDLVLTKGLFLKINTQSLFQNCSSGWPHSCGGEVWTGYEDISGIKFNVIFSRKLELSYHHYISSVHPHYLSSSFKSWIWFEIFHFIQGYSQKEATSMTTLVPFFMDESFNLALTVFILAVVLSIDLQHFCYGHLCYVFISARIFFAIYT